MGAVWLCLGLGWALAARVSRAEEPRLQRGMWVRVGKGACFVWGLGGRKFGWRPGGLRWCSRGWGFLLPGAAGWQRWAARGAAVREGCGSVTCGARSAAKAEERTSKPPESCTDRVHAELRAVAAAARGSRRCADTKSCKRGSRRGSALPEQVSEVLSAVSALCWGMRGETLIFPDKFFSRAAGNVHGIPRMKFSLVVSGNAMAGNCCVLCVERFPLRSSPALLGDGQRSGLPTPQGAARAVLRCAYLHPCPLCSSYYLCTLFSLQLHPTLAECTGCFLVPSSLLLASQKWNVWACGAMCSRAVSGQYTQTAFSRLLVSFTPFCRATVCREVRLIFCWSTALRGALSVSLRLLSLSTSNPSRRALLAHTDPWLLYQ